MYESYCSELQNVIENMENYANDLIYEFEGISNVGTGNIPMVDAFATSLLDIGRHEKIMMNTTHYYNPFDAGRNLWWIF